ncbi:DUF2931 family protein [Hymenobacter nivis]|uniref:DUF2931 family protein n=1 Tax=Hymenobacter nivis TaxID=1850093 RepID=A0A502GXA8_9BACT|nr:DUF2931 family protein [Hymenobacter nivis]TPG65860.1 DUF2931 family protein [Hymenobacter nivis]
MIKPPRFLRDFTWVNKLLLALAAIQVALMVAPVLRYQRWARQYWSTDAAGATDGVFDLLDGNFTSSGGDYTPLATGLVRAEADSIDSAGPAFPYQLTEHEDALRPVPRRLAVAWFSARERRFYRGAFTLPRARIDSLFAKYKDRTDTTGWHFYRQPRDYDALPAETEPGLVLSVQLSHGGKLSVAVLEASPKQYARPVVLARFQAAAYQPAWGQWRYAPYGAKNTQQYVDSLVSHLDSTQRMLSRRPLP